MDCSELLGRLTEEELLIIDCRDEDDWVSFNVRIPGSLHMSYGELVEGARVLPDDELIVLCGFAPDGSDARRAHRLLRMRGRMVTILDGGVREWVALGYPIEDSQRQLTHSHPP